jgi:hypothetical protein
MTASMLIDTFLLCAWAVATTASIFDQLNVPSDGSRVDHEARMASPSTEELFNTDEAKLVASGAPRS